VKPYYERAGQELYHCDARELGDSLNSAGAAVDLVLTDPPYGIKYSSTSSRTSATKSNDFGAIVGDSRPFDPTWLLAYPRLAIFGGNYFADKLPPSPSWLIWDKREDLKGKREIGFNDNADVELVWTNLGGPARIISHRWMGMIKGSEWAEARVHPTQKPVQLMAAIIRYAAKAGDLIVDFYAGSASTLLACAQEGCIGIASEIEEKYCEAAAKRMDEWFEAHPLSMMTYAREAPNGELAAADTQGAPAADQPRLL
jgi:DNA modification methylase